MIEASEVLYKAGMEELRERADDFACMENWVNQILYMQEVSVEPSLDIPSDEALKDAHVSLCGRATTLQAHLVALAPNDTVKKQFESVDFWKKPEITSGDGSFMRHLYLAYMESISRRNTLEASVHYQAARMFAAMGLGLSKNYEAAIAEFRRLMVSNLYPGNNKQLKAMKGMYLVIDSNLQAFRTFPVIDIGRFRITKLPGSRTTLEILGENHAIMTSLIGQYLRSE